MSAERSRRATGGYVTTGRHVSVLVRVDGADAGSRDELSERTVMNADSRVTTVGAPAMSPGPQRTHSAVFHFFKKTL